MDRRDSSLVLVLRVVTLNVWNLDGPWRQRRVEVVAWLEALEPDIVCLQEIIETADGRNQAQWIADAAGGFHTAYSGREIRPGVLFGNAVLSRWPIDHSADHDLPYEPAEGEVQRLVLHARTRGIDVFSTHLNWRFHDGVVRERQVLALADVVERSSASNAPLPPIVAGDFNAEPDSTEMRFLTGLTSLEGRSFYFQDAWRIAGGRGPGLTWDNRNPFAAAEHEPSRRIDYVLVGWRRDGGAGRVESARVVCDRALTGTFASDHLGLLVEVNE
jgi:endonuclease/exonuclease/phosphatase family metal-dependent hydrolase